MMSMHSVIQERRKALGLTQEQVAEYLNVSIPAVSKWETGQTNPDIALLPPLARLLKIDLNTLFDFQADISPQEIGHFSREIAAVVQAEGIAAGFEAAEQKIHEYPHSEPLLHCLALQLDGFLAFSGPSAHEAHQYEDKIVKWYEQLAQSKDSKVSNSAQFMLTSRCIRNGDYDRAQEILNMMPDKEDILSSMADKRMLQVTLHLRQGKTEQAIESLQSALLLSLNKVQLLLFRMIDAELASGAVQSAKSIAAQSSQMAALFGLWEYHSFVAPLQIATVEKNAGECMLLLQKMLAALLTPWDMRRSPLFCRIAKTSDPKQMLPAVLSDLENDPAYDFLRADPAFHGLISKYKAFLAQ